MTGMEALARAYLFGSARWSLCLEEILLQRPRDEEAERQRERKVEGQKKKKSLQVFVGEKNCRSKESCFI